MMERNAGHEKKGWSRLEIPLLCFLILLITFISFYPSLKNGFTNWDDAPLLTDNWMIRELSPAHVVRYFTAFHQKLYHPLVLLSFAVEYHFFKLDPLAYHTTNLILHLINCLLAFWLAFLMSKNSRVACLAALLFGIHPLRVQSVAWVAERKDLLFAMFYLASLISYISFRQKPRALYYALFIFSLLSKPLAATLPFILLLYDYLIESRLDGKAILEKAPYFACSFAIILITLPKMREGTTINFFHTVPIAGYVFLFYLSKILFPWRLSFSIRTRNT
jgi:protein O-mannosyl-transferase